MVPLFRLIQKRIHRVNLVLREQLTGIRVIRAFVRERHETERFADANAELTQTAVSAGRLFALMFPAVMLVMNVSSVAVIWFGGIRVGDGDIEVGTLMAFLQYLMQILMGVMMATFMGILLPRAAVSADRVDEVLETRTSVVNLLPRLFDVTGGSVLVDGAEVRELDPDLLWGLIGLVPQKPYLFSGTVASNLRYGKPDATDE